MSCSRYNLINGAYIHPRHRDILLQYRKAVDTLMNYTIRDNTVTYEFNKNTVVEIEIDSIEELIPFAKSYNALHFIENEEGTHNIDYRKRDAI